VLSDGGGKEVGSKEAVKGVKGDGITEEGGGMQILSTMAVTWQMLKKRR